jgi:hypothetical protein
MTLCEAVEHAKKICEEKNVRCVSFFYNKVGILVDKNTDWKNLKQNYFNVKKAEEYIP